MKAKKQTKKEPKKKLKQEHVILPPEELVKEEAPEFITIDRVSVALSLAQGLLSGARGSLSPDEIAEMSLKYADAFIEKALKPT